MLEVIAHGAITELRLNRPPANALNHDLLEALLASRDEAVRGGAKGLVLAGRPGMFCAGIDVPELLGQDRASIRRFWTLLFDAARSLASCPVPVVAALAGHSPAGGAVLASHCDYRIAAAGSFKVGFNEVQVGLPLPPTIMRAFAELVGARRSRQVAMQGTLLTMDAAHEIGLVDELVTADAVAGRSLEYLEGLLAMPPVAMNTTRLTGKADLLRALATTDDVETTTEFWFSAETQAAMQALVDSLKKD